MQEQGVQELSKDAWGFNDAAWGDKEDWPSESPSAATGMNSEKHPIQCLHAAAHMPCR